MSADTCPVCYREAGTTYAPGEHNDFPEEVGKVFACWRHGGLIWSEQVRQGDGLTIWEHLSERRKAATGQGRTQRLLLFADEMYALAEKPTPNEWERVEWGRKIRGKVKGFVGDVREYARFTEGTR